ncbi:helix-turn-helix transcriptional regulator [uncultured Tateyamaria sp.]|uniref:AraC family transcriptional regulator n=1 Tax=uncultured Tateyamaria sp. TaxID=455651 RepID=UPI0026055E17|nr:helix-turn-helix transcriptional regulator [uncultured Tateyamaria sp.]
MPNLTQPDIVGFASTYPSGTYIDWHAHEAHQLIHAISGAMRVSLRDKLCVLPVGRALWIPATIDHAIECAGAVRMRTAYVSPHFAELPRDVHVIVVSPLAREVLVRLAEVNEAGLKPALNDVLVHEINNSPVKAFVIPLPRHTRIARLAEALRADPASGKTLTDWAADLGFSERNLIRRIQEETGMTFRELRRQTRIMVAMERLVNGQAVTSVALDVGFETPSAFIHAFRLVTGETPRQFVKSD